ncbi:MAG: permease [Planctomycetota bacterium]
MDWQVYAGAMLLRFCQVAMQAAPTFVIGLAVAAVMRRMMGPELVREWFGGKGWAAIFRAWLAGMLLPVCAFGTIPIMREMKRCGISGGGILAFGLTAPLFNPASVLYGLTLSSPLVILSFTMASLVIVTVIGLSWDRLFGDSAEPAPADPMPTPGLRRLVAVLFEMFREATGPSLVYFLIGAAGVVGLSLLLPNASLQTSAEASDWWAPLFMVLVAVPVFQTPLGAIVQVASMFEHGNSVGAAFGLLVVGTGLNLGTLAWIGRQFGWSKMFGWLALFLVCVTGLAYAMDRPLMPRGIDIVGHTHAFDSFCFPFTDQESARLPRIAAQLERDLLPHELVGLIGMGALLLGGLGLRFFDRRQLWERWSCAESAGQPRYDRNVPPRVLAGVTVAGLVGLSAVGCYLYYPSPQETLRELREVNIRIGSAALSGDWDTGAVWVPNGEDWAHKLTVGGYLRGQPPSRFQAVQKEVFLDKLERLEHAVEDRDAELAKRLGLDLQNALRRLRNAYVGE